MNYAAARHLVPLSTEGAGDSLPWETDAESSPARQETWLLSFIDILALLLTLFVLLLAYQDRGPAAAGSAVDTAPSSMDFSLLALNLANAVPLALPVDVAGDAAGYAMPGAGLLPQATVVVPPGPAISGSGVSAPAAANEQPAAASQKDDASVAGVTETATGPVEGEPADEPVTAASPTTVQHAGGDGRESGEPAMPTDADEQGSPTAVDQVLATLNQTPLADRVEMSVQRGAVSLDISDSILFSPGSAALSTEGVALLNELAVILQSLPYHLSVEGHSDNRPIRTARYPSNWELSSVRAVRVTRSLIEQGIDPDRIRAIGYGDTRPRGDNASAEGRAKNRRVTFILQVGEQPVGLSLAGSSR